MDFEDQILRTCEIIDKNLANNNLCDERGFVSQVILSQLRNLVEYIFQKIHSGEEKIDTNEYQQTINENAIKYIKSKGGNFTFLIRFHNFLDKSVSHYTLTENSSERLMLKYFMYLVECKNFLRERYKIEVLRNLDKFPLNLDKKFMEYYEKIAEKLENQGILNNYYKENGVYYITKIKPFIVKGQIYYEVTFVNAVDNFSKFDKLIAFCKFRIFDNYAVNLWIRNENIKILNKSLQVKIIDSWEVSIRPAELQNFGKIFECSQKINRTSEHKELMQFLTRKKISLVDLIDSYDYQDIKRNIISKGQVSHIFDILDKAKAVTKDGRNTIRYLLHNLRNQVIKKQLPNNEDRCLSDLKLNSKYLPFEQMPFATSLINHNPNFYDLLECIDTSGREHELFARAVKSRIENSGSLFVDKKEFNFNNIDNLRSQFNSKLWTGNEKNPKGHTGRRIEEFQSYFYIKEYVEKSIEIIDGLDKLTQSGIQNYSNSVKEWIKKNSTLIDDKEKENIVINLFEKSKVALIYGAAGTGKTTLIDYVSQFFKENSKIFLANTNTAIDNLKRRIFADSNSEFKTVAKLIASKNTKCDILIIDECSTISNDDMQKVLNKVEFGLILLVGDVYQIEAISFGNWFKIAPNFIGKVAFKLEKTYRTKDKKLLKLWDEVRSFGDCISEILQRESYSQKLEDLSFEASDDEIVLCLNYDGLYGINNLNTILQETNKAKAVEWGLHRYKIGDPILFNEVERFKPLIYNNMKGKIINIELAEKRIWFSIELEKSITGLDAQKYDFELLENSDKSVIKFYVNQYGTADEEGNPENNDEETIVPFHVAYAISIHKAQGLEYKTVKVVISSEVDEMITHNIFYTAITRAKENLQIYWSPEVEKKILESFKKRNSNKDIDFLQKLKK